MTGLFLLPLFFFGCSGPDTGSEVPETKLSLSVEEISVTHEAEDMTVTVTADGDWGVSSKDKSWVNVSPGGGGAGTSDVKVKIDENKTYDQRETELVFMTKSGSTGLPVRQEGKEKPVVDNTVKVPEGYSLIWQDEFNDPDITMPDTDLWWYENAEPGWVNNELQTYIPGKKDDVVTAEVSDGTLKIRAIKKGTRVYSARVNTKEAWTYGYFEARLKLPKGKGTWPAFWMMPKESGRWPLCGEIDIMEHVGCVPTEVSSSVHCQEYYHAINTQKTAARKISTVMDEFHTYALEWTPEYIKTYVDGVELFYYNPDDYPKGRNENTWPFDKAFYLKLNLAWGGDWGGMYGVDESCLPATYEIDYVRVFQKNE